MADTVPVTGGAAPKKAGKGKKPKKPSTHPKTSEMVTAAITNLKERNGSSLQAIKKYIGATYKADVAKLAPFIKKAVKAGVTSGKLVQVKGKGASGSFKLSTAGGKPKKEKAVKSKKAKSPKKATGGAAKPKKPAAKKAAKPKKAKTPTKVKKAKSPKKPKAPKTKKAAKPKAKKATPKKK